MPGKLGVFVVGDDEEDGRVSSSGDAVRKEEERGDEMSAASLEGERGKTHSRTFIPARGMSLVGWVALLG